MRYGFKYLGGGSWDHLGVTWAREVWVVLLRLLGQIDGMKRFSIKYILKIYLQTLSQPLNHLFLTLRRRFTRTPGGPAADILQGIRNIIPLA